MFVPHVDTSLTILFSNVAREEAGGVLVWFDLFQLRLALGADALCVGASGVESASLGRVDRAGDFPLWNDALQLCFGVWHRN